MAASWTYSASRFARPPLQLVNLFDPFEVPRVDDRDRAEHDPLEVMGKHPKQGEERVPSEPAVAADEEDRDRLRGVDPSDRLAPSVAHSAGKRPRVEGVRELDVEMPDRADDEAVVRPDRETERDEHPGDHEREPPTVGELLEAGDDQGMVTQSASPMRCTGR